MPEDFTFTMNAPSIYQYKGYRNRQHYLACLAEDYGVDLELIKVLADELGPNEDFDALPYHVDELSDLEA